MIRVKVYGRDDAGFSKVFGEITWNDGQFKLIPHGTEFRLTLQEVLDHQIDGFPHNKDSDPELWLRNLWKLFSGPLLKVSKAVNR